METFDQIALIALSEISQNIVARSSVEASRDRFSSTFFSIFLFIILESPLALALHSYVALIIFIAVFDH